MLPGYTQLIPWPEIRAAAAKRALGRQAWRDAIKNLVLLELKKPQEVGRMAQSCARHGESGYCCALPSMRSGSRRVLLIQVPP
eukprot:364096-Chlamydomonas_euryale.AAC.2